VFRPPNLYSDKFDANEVRTYKTTIDENQLHILDGEPTQPLSHREQDDMEHLSHQRVCAWMEARFGTVKNAFRQFDANKDGAVDMEEMYDRLVQEQTVLGIPVRGPLLSLSPTCTFRNKASTQLCGTRLNKA
jgi:hypothetical protein